MALDGIVVANLVSDMQCLVGARIAKIVQPEKDEILLTLNGNKIQYKLLISSNASLPLVYFTENPKKAPLTAPNFCMLLRKHIGNGRIISVSQVSLERIIRFEIEHLDEMGDLARKYLVVEIMGKHSNIIFLDSDDVIIDSIKRVPAHLSSLREVLPGRNYFLPEDIMKKNTLETEKDEFISLINDENAVSNSLCKNFAGISTIVAEEICFRSGTDPDAPINYQNNKIDALYESFKSVVDDIKSKDFAPNIVYVDEKPVEFSSIALSVYGDATFKGFNDASYMLETYYAEKESASRMKQKSSDIRRITETALARESKKLDLQLKQLKDTDKMDKYRTYGDLLRTYAYMIEPGQKSVSLEDYTNDNKEVTITLDENLSASDNANKFYDRYQKLRRTKVALEDLIKETKESVEWLSEIKESIGNATNEEDLAQIKDELGEAGYVKKNLSKGSSKITRKANKPSKSEPLHFITDDGYDIYVGKNNYQNEQVTFEIAEASDWWFHVKGRPGSHVVVKAKGEEILPNKTYEEAGALAAYYSSATKGEKVDIDYTTKRNLKKPANYRPGLVIYHTNYSLVAEAKIPASVKEV